MLAIRGNLNGIANDFKNAQLAIQWDTSDLQNTQLELQGDCHDLPLASLAMTEKAFFCHTEVLTKTEVSQIRKIEIFRLRLKMTKTEIFRFLIETSI